MTFWNISAALKSQLSHQSGLNHRINTVLPGRTVAVGIAIVTSSMTFLCLYISRWWRQTWDTPPYLTVVNQSEARISTEHGIMLYILHMSRQLAKRSYRMYRALLCQCFSLYRSQVNFRRIRIRRKWPSVSVAYSQNGVPRFGEKYRRNVTGISAWLPINGRVSVNCESNGHLLISRTACFLSC